MSAWHKVWLYLKKVVTVVLAVAVVLFVLIQFPGVPSEKQSEFERSLEGAYNKFLLGISDTTYASEIDTKEKLMSLIVFSDNYRQERARITEASVLERLNERYQKENELFFRILRDRSDKEALKVERELRRIVSFRKTFFREIKDEKIANSFLGIAGKMLEYVTQYAGFDWKINIAFLSSFAARESFVATLGALFEESTAEGVRPEEGIRTQGGYTPLAGVAMILFMALTPPCIATIVVLKTQLASWGWMIFALLYPLVLGLIVAIAVHSIGNSFGIPAISMLLAFYGIVLISVIMLGLVPDGNFNQRQRRNNG